MSRFKCSGLVIDAEGNRYWYLDGRLHREDGLPAIEGSDGYKAWYLDGRLYREGGLPAVEYADGTREWYVNDELHMIQWNDGYIEVCT